MIEQSGLLVEVGCSSRSAKHTSVAALSRTSRSRLCVTMLVRPRA